MSRVRVPGLPIGFEVQIKDDVRLVDRGRVLIGGSPTRAARLSETGAALIRRGRVTVADEASRRLADRLLEGNLATPRLHGSAVSVSELTVVIPVKDRPQQLKRLLSGLSPQLDCVVVDDASIDGTSVAAVTRQYGARLVRHSRNQGPAAARNTGLRRVVTPYVAFVDSDVETLPETLLGLCGHFLDPRVAAVAPRVRGVARGDASRWYQRYDEISMSLDLGERQSLVRPDSHVAWLPSACLVVRRESVGEGFDESMRVAEDVDFVWRLIAAGERVRYDGTYVVRHDSRGSLSAWLGRKVYYGTGGALLARRHGNLVAPAVMSPAFAVASIAMLAQRRWSTPVVAGCTMVTAIRIHRALPMVEGRAREAGLLASRGLSSVLSQTAQLILRHWWPITACLMPFSARARRAVVAAAVIDTLLTPLPPSGRRGSLFVARRLDDLAYGAGLWLGAARSRSVRALLPRGSASR